MVQNGDLTSTWEKKDSSIQAGESHNLKICVACLFSILRAQSFIPQQEGAFQSSSHHIAQTTSDYAVQHEFY